MVSSMSTNAKASVPASSRGTAVASPVRTREWTASSCRTCPKEKERRNVPNVDGARTLENTFPMPPWRSTSRSSMQSAPASIPPITLAALTGAFGDATVRCPCSRSCKPARSASRITGINPAEPIRFGSSKTVETPCDACT